MGIEHNIEIMHRMAAERQFGNLLEAARSEKSWKNAVSYTHLDVYKRQNHYSSAFV